MAPRSCADCMIKLGIFKKKHKCGMCLMDFCDRCFSKVKMNAVVLSDKLTALGSRKSCLQCIVLSYRSISRTHLFLLTNRDLTKYLAARNIGTNHCKEKYHLVDLIMDFAASQGMMSHDDIDSEALRNQLVEQMRQAAIARQAEEQRSGETVSDGASEEDRNRVQDSRLDSSVPSQSPAHSGLGASVTTGAGASFAQLDSGFIRQDANSSSTDSPETVQSDVRSDDVSRAQASSNTSPPGTASPVKSTSRWKSMDDLECEEDIYALTVLELKQILTANFISYKGCVEKGDLVDKVKMLYQSERNTERGSESMEKASPGDAYERDLCKICMDRLIDCVFLDCGHLVSCTKCGKVLAECPICRSLIVRVVHIFRV